MKARQILRKYVRTSKIEDVGVIAIYKNELGKLFWYQVHKDEKLPTKEQGLQDIAIHIRPNKEDRKEISGENEKN